MAAGPLSRFLQDVADQSEFMPSKFRHILELGRFLAAFLNND